MILVKDILMDTEKGIFINILTGVKLVIKKEGDRARLIEKEIEEEDIRRAFQENVIDITLCKQLKPSESEINLFKLFIFEYINGNHLFKNFKIIC